MKDLFGNASTLDTGARAVFDFYPTPAWMTRSLLVHHPEIAGAVVLECASGDDAITDVLRQEAGCRVFTNDIDPAQPAHTHLDATQPELWSLYRGRREAGRSIEWVVTNPAFTVAFEMVQHAVETAAFGVAFLLRKTFLEPTEERGPWLAAHPPTRIIGLPRHKFRAGADSTDSVSCDWMIWAKWRVEPPLPPIVIDHLAKTRTRRLCPHARTISRPWDLDRP